MKLLNTSITALLVALSFSASVAQENATMSLREAQDYAVKNAFSVKSALSDQLNAGLSVDELIGIGLPQVNASLQYQNYIDLPTSLVPAEFFGGEPGSFAKLQFGTPHNMTVGLSASQLLFDGSWLVGLQASRAYADLQKKQVLKSEIQVRNDVASAYYLALISQRNLELLQESRKVIASLLDDTKAMYENGFVEEQDVQQLQLSLNDFDNRLAYADEQVKLTYDMLKFNMGMPLSTSLGLTESADELIGQSSSDALASSMVVDTYIDVQLVQGGLEMQKLSLKNQRAKLLPQAGAFYNLQSQAQRNAFNFFDTSQPWFPVQLWGVQLNVPIFSGMSKSKSVQKGKVEVQRMTDMLAMTREATQLEFNAARSELEYAQKNHTASKNNLELATDILRKTNIRFKEGLASSFEVSQGTNQVLVAQSTYIQAMLQLLNADARMNKLLGR